MENLYFAEDVFTGSALKYRLQNIYERLFGDVLFYELFSEESS